MRKGIEESVVRSMDGSDPELFPFLPYIFQDFTELGADPETVVGLVRRHAKDYERLTALDLGCGKGAVSLRLARELRCSCLGIDAVGAFVEHANARAIELGIADLCRFEEGDVRERMSSLPCFDVVILGSTGPLLGDYRSTLAGASGCLCEGGFVIMDDGYIEEGSDFIHPVMLKRDLLLKHIEEAGMRLIEEAIAERERIAETERGMFRMLKRRCGELMELHPDKRELFESYVKRQIEEGEVIKSRAVCSTMVIGR